MALTTGIQSKLKNNLRPLPESKNYINWTAVGTAKVAQMRVIATHLDETFEALIEISKADQTIKFTLLVVNEEWSLNFTVSDVQSVWSSLPDNRKVYLRMNDVELGIIFADVFKKH